VTIESKAAAAETESSARRLLRSSGKHHKTCGKMKRTFLRRDVVSDLTSSSEDRSKTTPMTQHLKVRVVSDATAAAIRWIGNDAEEMAHAASAREEQAEQRHKNQLIPSPGFVSTEWDEHVG
jgi:hypothetical protein